MRLWRAAGSYCGRWSCWAAARTDAEAYLDNPGYGGGRLWTCEVEPEYVLDLTGRYPPWRVLAAAVMPDDDEDDRIDASDDWRMTQGSIYGVLENISAVRREVEAHYDWVVYDDDYPDGCQTWVYTGRAALPVVPV